MTDLEITRLCAEAMGFDIKDNLLTSERFVTVRGLEYAKQYDPLRNYAQCFELIKQFDLTVSLCIRDLKIQGVNSGYVVRSWNFESVNDDLNRAICECVAKMQAAKVAA